MEVVARMVLPTLPSLLIYQSIGQSITSPVGERMTMWRMIAYSVNVLGFCPGFSQPRRHATDLCVQIQPAKTLVNLLGRRPDCAKMSPTELKERGRNRIRNPTLHDNFSQNSS